MLLTIRLQASGLRRVYLDPRGPDKESSDGQSNYCYSSDHIAVTMQETGRQSIV
jgi:hypothetical protein